MAMNDGLLDYLTARLNLDYLSDLRYKAVDRERLGCLLEGLPEERYPATEWQDACAYIANRQAADAPAARAALLRFCQAREDRDAPVAGQACRRNAGGR